MAGENLATLGLIVDATGAKREIQLTGDELKKLANGGKEAASVMRNLGPAMAPPASVAPAVNRVSEAIKRMQDAARQSGAAKFAEDLRLLEERNNRAVTATQRLSDAMNRMRQSAQQAQAAAMASMIQAADPFQKQAAVAAKATVNFGRLRESLTGVAMAAVGASGPLGSFASTLGMMTAGAPIMVGVLAGVAALGFAWSKMGEKSRKATEELQKQLDVLRAIKREQDLGIEGEAGAGVKAGRSRLAGLAGTINGQQRLIDSGQLQGTSLAFAMQARDAAIKEYTEIALLVSAGEKKVTQIRKDELDKQAADRRAAFDKEIADQNERLRQAQARTAADGNGLSVKLGGASMIGSASSLTVGKMGPEVFAALAAQGVRAKDAMERLTRAMIVLGQVTEAEARKAAVRSMAGSAGLSLLTQYGGAGGGVAAAMIQGGMQAGPLGAAIGGGSALISMLVGMGQSSRQAAEAMRALRASLDDTILSWRAELGEPGADRALKESRIRAQGEEAKRQALEANKPLLTGDPGTDWRRRRAAEEAYRKEAERIDKLTAARIEALDKEKAAIDTVTRSMENMVDGYRYQAAIFKASTPKGPTFPGTPTGILPGGGLLGSGNLTVNVTLPNGEVLASTVIANFQQQAQDQYGDSTRWSEIQ